MAASSISVSDRSGTAQSIGTITNAASVQAYQVTGDVNVATYSASKSALAPVATPTASFILPGNATTTVRLKQIILNGTATAAGEMKFQIKKNSDAGTLGSAVLTALTSVPLDSGMAAASSAASTVGTANYTTLPALVGAIYSSHLQFGAIDTAVGFNGPQVINFGQNGIPAVVLRGTAQSVTVDFLGDGIPAGGIVDCTFVWSEDAS